MKVLQKNLLLSLTLGLSILLSCKKNETITDPKPDEPIVVPPPVTTVPPRNLLPVQFKTGQSTITFTYKQDHNLLAINYDKKTSTEISYSAQGKLNGIIRYKNEEMVSLTQLTLNKNGLIIQADHISITENEYIPTGYYTLAYNTAEQLVSVTYYNASNKLINQQQKTYAPAGKLDYETWNLPDLTIKYGYDDENGIFKNVAIAFILALEKEHLFFDAISHNRLEAVNSLYPQENQSFSYTYNKDRYPETVTSTLQGKTSTTTVSYEAIP